MAEFFPIIVFIVLAASIAVLLFFILGFAAAKCRTMDSKSVYLKEQRSLEALDDIIKSSVIYTNQKLVNPQKKLETFFQQDKEEAFQTTKEKIYNTLKDSHMDIVATTLKNPEEWIDNRIEYYVRLHKI